MKRAPGKYDPARLVELVRAQRPEEEELLAALAGCVRKAGECECGCRDPYLVGARSQPNGTTCGVWW